ncbi:hypothetical protein N7495_006689 [Penicillium taxi]|uniref:uncharacterized protein n=1 Tax=Penicillium taxi TaxID=168475 RepID=UPI0025451785|nr:uncharacterized protein N7495_006689 [Penicillium taxi]KAJ5894998.1 hypothetical protein N7495_006689 [Penicillium taxi]
MSCRTSKTKCSGERPSCKRCQDKAESCFYSESSQPSWIRRVEPISKAASLQIPYSVPENSPSDQLEPSSVQTSEQNATPQSAYISYEQSPSIEVTGRANSPLNWLTAPQLPGPWKVGLLVEDYFNNIHPLRCFAFIHRPSFLQTFDKDLSQNYQEHALLHIICALGAQFHALSYSESVAPLLPRFILHAGSQWSKTAQRLILESLDTVTVENLMASVLLHDYAIRMGNFANAFMLSGLITRMTQALQINLEYNTDILCQNTEVGPSVTERESRRRLMWCCYVTDALVGSGVDQLTLVDERDMKIQLPCNERNFIQKIAYPTEILDPGNCLKFIPNEQLNLMMPNMGIMAIFIRHIAIRKKVLRYIKHLDEAMVPWEPESEFAILAAECHAWYDSLPARLQFTSDSIYVRKDSSQLGALCALHCAHYQTICDLYRLGAPALYKLRSAFEFPPEQQVFLRHLQKILFDAARTIANIVGETARHGTRMLADSWLPTITYDSSRIIVYHLTQILDPSLEESKILMMQSVPHLRSNIKCLKSMGCLYVIANSLASAAETMFERSGIGSEVIARNSIPDDPYEPIEEDETNESLPGTPVQSAPDYVLNPLSIFRLARKSVPERHAPEKATTSSSGPNSSRPDSSSNFDSSTDGSLTQNVDIELGQASLEEIQNLFMSDLGWAWQPADTAVGSGIEGAGLLPWAGGYPVTQAEPWLPVFPFPQQN